MRACCRYGGSCGHEEFLTAAWQSRRSLSGALQRTEYGIGWACFQSETGPFGASARLLTGGPHPDRNRKSAPCRTGEEYIGSAGFRHESDRNGGNPGYSPVRRRGPLWRFFPHFFSAKRSAITPLREKHSSFSLLSPSHSGLTSPPPSAVPIPRKSPSQGCACYPPR